MENIWNPIKKNREFSVIFLLYVVLSFKYYWIMGTLNKAAILMIYLTGLILLSNFIYYKKLKMMLVEKNNNTTKNSNYVTIGDKEN